MKYSILALLLVVSPASAFTFTAYNIMEELPGELYDSSPGDTFSVFRSLNNAVAYGNLNGNGVSTEEIEAYFSSPDAYRIEVLDLEIIFLDALTGPDFEATILFPNGFSVLHSNPPTGSSDPIMGAYAPITDLQTLNDIGRSKTLAYQVRHESGSLSNIRDLQHNMTLRVTKVSEPSTLILSALALLLLGVRRLSATKSYSSISSKALP